MDSKYLFCFFDTETTGFVRSADTPLDDPGQPWAVQIACLLSDIDGNEYGMMSVILQRTSFSIPFQVAQIHGIDDSVADRFGIPRAEAFKVFTRMLNQSNFMIAHNFDYDWKILQIAEARGEASLPRTRFFCTMKETTDICRIPKTRGAGYKWPKLQELHVHLFGEEFVDAHDALADVRATKRCFLHLVQTGQIVLPPLSIA